MTSQQKKRKALHLSKPLHFPLLLFLGLCLFPLQECPAQNLFVRPSIAVPLRTGQGNDYKIIAMLKPGTEITLLEKGENYSKIQLSPTKEGWILSRYLRPEPPPDQLVGQLRAEKNSLQEETATLKEENQGLTAALHEARLQLEQSTTDTGRLQRRYEQLMQDTVDVRQTKEKLLKTEEENIRLAEKLAKIESQYTALQKDDKMHWFLVGVGTILFGIILGRLSSLSRKRRSSIL